MKIRSLFLIIIIAASIQAQSLKRDFDRTANGLIEITNLYGRVEVTAEETQESTISISADADKSLTESEMKIENVEGTMKIEIVPNNPKARIDLTVKLPLRYRVRITTGKGEVRVSGDLTAAQVETDTGTIVADVPLDDVRYNFNWTESRPRFVSDVELEKVKEKAAGRFQIKGKINQESKVESQKSEEESEEGEETPASGKNDKKSNSKERVELNLTTARGIILLNVNPNEVPSDLRERPLTNAAKAIIRSGDSMLTEAIRRASPKNFGDYAKTLPPLKGEPVLSENKNAQTPINSPVKKVLVRVTDLNNRAIANLNVSDFELTESGEKREILRVESTTAPFNLVLLLDVSGSIDHYVDFIRKAARNFVNTANREDKIAIVIFNEDVKTLSTFTTNKGKLSESLDTFDAGGGTAFYDALAFTLAETLRPLRGERTGIIVLSDGDDNRSFLSFDALLGSIQESGALIYPLYVPSGLIAASETNNSNTTIDPLRSRYIALTSKAESEGEKLAQISGGVYYPIRQISEIQKAYDDIVVQLRTAYSITFRSNVAEIRDNRASPRLKVKVNRENAFVKLGSVIEVKSREISELNQDYFPQRAQRNEQAFQSVSFNNNLINFADFSSLKGISFQIGEISAEVENIKYKQFLGDKMQITNLENLDINKTTGAFLLANDGKQLAVSRWISPKRTRSYPYERVYDTLGVDGKKVTIIPVVKDEGLGGERDFLQWDTISLLSLLDVHVVLAYYSEATKNLKRNDQITAQKFDNNYIQSQLNEVFNFKGTAREWNEQEAKKLKSLFEKARNAYREISKNTKTYLHDETPLNELIKITSNPNDFAAFSRLKSQKGQSRELQSIQPKEALSTDTKGRVTITNLAGGKYFFTCDETRIEAKTLFLIEDKHSSRAIMPSENDIKDGLLKLMVYTNLKNVRVGKNSFTAKAVLRLTSNKLVGSINSDASEAEIIKFFETNKLELSKQNFIKKLFQEARENKFMIILEHGETA